MPSRPVVAVLATLAVLLCGCAGATPTPPTPPTPPTGPASALPSQNRVPGRLLDLTNWYLTLPTGVPEDPDDVFQPELATYSGPYFQVDAAGTGVVFTVNAGGVTTTGSSYPRSELREMDGGEKAAWSNISGTHTMTVRGAVRALPPVKPEIVVAQIHDEEDDVVLVRVEDSRLFVEWDDGDGEAMLDPAYRLGSVYDIRITAAQGRVDIHLDGQLKATVPKSGSGWYFKAGAYLQSNVDRGDAADAVGEAVIERLTVEHTP